MHDVRPRRLDRRFIPPRVLAAWGLATLVGCAPAPRGGEPFAVHDITPTFLLSLETQDPSIAADARGHVAVSWVRRDSSGADLWLTVSEDSGATFTPPMRVNLASGRVVSFPEGRPDLRVGAGGALAIAWSERRADTSRAVDLRVRASADFGRTFGAIATVNDDVLGPPAGLRWRQLRDWDRTHRPDAFHGFPALAFLADGSLLAAWLDERGSSGPDEPRISSLYRAVSHDGGQTWGFNAAVTDSACPCCRPGLAGAPDGAVALIYRGASNDLRDPRLAVSRDGGQSFATDTLVSRDGWQMQGCPVQGPSIVWNRPDGGSAVWFTGAEPHGVYVVPWRRNSGPTGMRRAVDDSMVDADHPQAVGLGEALLVGVSAQTPGDSTRRTFAVRALDSGGTWSGWTLLGANAGSGVLAAGARHGYACWVERDAGHARLRIAALMRRGGVRG